MKKLLLIVLGVLLLQGSLFSLLPVETAAFDSKEHPKGKSLKLPFDMGYVPFHYYNEKNEAVGFGIEVSKELARRLGRPGLEVVDVNWSGIFAGLFAKQYEAITFTLNITKERSEMMDYTEPFMDSGLKMACRKAEADKFRSPADYRGFKIGVNSGSVADTWVTKNDSTYGFEVVRFDKVDEAILGLMTKKLDGVLAQIATISTFVKEKPGLANAFVISPVTEFGLGHAGYGIAVRPGDPYRDEIERVIEGMKLDGTLQKLMEPYFGKPAPGDYANVVFTGYGVPGLKAYRPDAYHQPYVP